MHLQGLKMEVWADENGLPLEMRQEGDTELHIDYRFKFDQASMDKQLSIAPPSDYELVQPDDD